MHDRTLDPCPGCGDRLPLVDGATHPYVGASSACWIRFTEINATLPPVTPLRRLVTDAYMVQHPGVPERRAIQSVGLHLVGMCLALEHGLPPERLTDTLRSILARPPAWRWLEPPVPNGSATMGSLEAAVGGRPEEMAAVIEAYVRGVWSSWRAHRPTVEGWIADAGLA